MAAMEKMIKLFRVHNYPTVVIPDIEDDMIFRGDVKQDAEIIEELFAFEQQLRRSQNS
jgi:hypothetical protein